MDNIRAYEEAAKAAAAELERYRQALANVDGEALAFAAKASFLCARAEGPLERETGTGARAVAV